MKKGNWAIRVFSFLIITFGLIYLNRHVVHAGKGSNVAQENQVQRLYSALKEQKIPTQEGLPKGDWTSMAACSQGHGKVDATVRLRYVTDSRERMASITFVCLNEKDQEFESPYYFELREFSVQDGNAIRIPLLVDREYEPNISRGIRESVHEMLDPQYPTGLWYRDMEEYGEAMRGAIVHMDVIEKAVRLYINDVARSAALKTNGARALNNAAGQDVGHP